jgi:small subunit ribosomal protein S16
MVVIRLSRGGAKKRPFYHIVVTDRRKKRDGAKIERIGFFNPMAVAHETRFQFDKERMKYWMAQGAQPSPRVADLVKRHAA